MKKCDNQTPMAAHRDILRQDETPCDGMRRNATLCDTKRLRAMKCGSVQFHAATLASLYGLLIEIEV